MKILINTDKNISGTENMREPLKDSIEHAFERLSDHITRIEVKISDENGDKDSALDKRCVMEARLKGMDPIVVTSHGDTIDNAVDEAIDKMKASLDTVIGRLRNH
jgi:ribosome-associated translation inhibitor RaiA